MKAFPIVKQLNAASLVTSASVLLGVGACHLAMSGRIGPAVACAALAIPCDVLDGLVARKLNQVSEFGGALDSLADTISFCIAPSVLAHAMGVSSGWTVGLWAYPLAGAWRLARFAQVGMLTVNGRPCFQGLPTSLGAAGFYLLSPVVAGLTPELRSAVLGGYLLGAAVAMNAGFAVPKSGWHTKLLWVLVPLAAVASLGRWW